MYEKWRDKVWEAYTHLHLHVVQQKNTFHNYDEESIDINPLGQIIVSTALSAIIAINSPAAPDASSAYHEVKCHSWYSFKKVFRGNFMEYRTDSNKYLQFIKVSTIRVLISKQSIVASNRQHRSKIFLGFSNVKKTSIWGIFQKKFFLQKWFYISYVLNILQWTNLISANEYTNCKRML